MNYVIDLGLNDICAGAPIPEDTFLDYAYDFILEPQELEAVAETYRCTKFPYSLKPGIYFLFLDDRMVYVGKATDLCLRLRQHYMDKRFNRVAYVTGIPEMFIEDVEAFYIHAATPDLNRQYPPKGRVCRAMLGMIQRASSQ